MAIPIDRPILQASFVINPTLLTVCEKVLVFNMTDEDIVTSVSISENQIVVGISNRFVRIYGEFSGEDFVSRDNCNEN